MQSKVIAPRGNKQRDACVRVGCQHAFVGNPHGVDEVGLDSLDETAQSLSGAANRQGPEPLPDGGAQAHGPRGSGAGTLSPFFEAAESHGNDLESIQSEVRRADKCGGKIHIIASFGEIPDPVLGDGGAAVSHEEEAHSARIIRHCPPDGDAV